MKFAVNLNKEQWVAIGKGAGKIGKAIIVEGTKAVALKGAAAVITQSFDEGVGGIKDLSLDDVIKGGKKKKPKKSLFAFKKAVAEEALEEVVEDLVETEDNEDVDVNVEVEVVEGEIIDAK